MMSPTIECLELDHSFDYKQLKKVKEAYLHSQMTFSFINNTTWCLQIDRIHPKKLGVYLTLIDGAPCTLSSYTISITTNTKPPLLIFTNRCTQQRIFPSNNFSWGFENFCTRHDLKDERHLIRDPKTKLVNVRCTMNMEIFTATNVAKDHLLATDFFHRYSPEQWIELLKHRNDLPELNNRVNQEIEARLMS